jgi:membrane protein implicated in regulation of membrane protease activity
MNINLLHRIFNICLGIGFILPILSIVTARLGGFFDMGVDADMDFDADIGFEAGVDADMGFDAGTDGGGFGGVVPFNTMCFCLLLVVFGACGKVCAKWMTSPGVTAAILPVILAVAVFFYWMLYVLVVRRLKSSNPLALSYDSLAGRRGEVTLPVRAGRIGMISVKDSTGSYISFRARMDPDLESFIGDVIPQGEIIIVTEVNVREKLCYVSTLQEKFIHQKI